MADPETLASLGRLIDIMARLRAPGGCPWDREQTHASLRPYLVEEAYEVLDTIDRGDTSALRDELGDVLLQVVFHADIAAEDGRFGLADVARAIADKLVRRPVRCMISSRSASSLPTSISSNGMPRASSRRLARMQKGQLEVV